MNRINKFYFKDTIIDKNYSVRYFKNKKHTVNNITYRIVKNTTLMYIDLVTIWFFCFNIISVNSFYKSFKIIYVILNETILFKITVFSNIFSYYHYIVLPQCKIYSHTVVRLGTGYRVHIDNNKRIFDVGYSDLKIFPLKKDVFCTIDTINTSRTLYGKSDVIIINIVSSIEKLRPFNKYSGSGILRKNLIGKIKSTK